MGTEIVNTPKREPQQSADFSSLDGVEVAGLGRICDKGSSPQDSTFQAATGVMNPHELSEAIKRIDGSIRTIEAGGTLGCNRLAQLNEDYANVKFSLEEYKKGNVEMTSPCGEELDPSNLISDRPKEFRDIEDRILEQQLDLGGCIVA